MFSKLQIFFDILYLVPLSDPTWFAPVINYVKSIAEHMKNDPNNYLVLLIITDGGIEGKPFLISLFLQ